MSSSESPASVRANFRKLQMGLLRNLRGAFVDSDEGPFGFLGLKGQLLARFDWKGKPTREQKEAAKMMEQLTALIDLPDSEILPAYRGFMLGIHSQKFANSSIGKKRSARGGRNGNEWFQLSASQRGEIVEYYKKCRRSNKKLSHAGACKKVKAFCDDRRWVIGPRRLSDELRKFSADSHCLHGK